MTKEGINKFLTAVDAAKIEFYSMDTDLGTHFYNNKENSIIIADDSNEIAWCFRKNDVYGSGTMFAGSDCLSMCSDYADIHECRVGGTYKQIKEFMDSLGLEMTDVQRATFESFGATKKPIFPITGDYTFKELSAEEYNALDSDTKAKYDEELRLENLRKDGLLTRAVNIM
jgi:hypothetical protein